MVGKEDVLLIRFEVKYLALIGGLPISGPLIRRLPRWRMHHMRLALWTIRNGIRQCNESTSNRIIDEIQVNHRRWKRSTFDRLTLFGESHEECRLRLYSACFYGTTIFLVSVSSLDPMYPYLCEARIFLCFQAQNKC